jgi:shikimate dehydrogenase
VSAGRSSPPGRGIRRCAVLGSPVAHSLSPTLHRAAYAHLGLDWTYEAIEVPESGLAAFVDALDESWRGLSLTMPLKSVGVEVATDRVEPVPTVGVTNTLVLEAGRRTAYNTDVAGLQAALAAAGVTRVERATVIGGGSTAVAAVAALAPMADGVVACVRSRRRAGAVADVAQRLGVALSFAGWDDTPAHLGAPLVVSTTPVGSTDGLSSHVPRSPGLLFDVVYDPWPTLLAAAWQASGGDVLSGLDLLVHQAVGQVELMTGHHVSVAVLRDAVASR